MGQLETKPAPLGYDSLRLSRVSPPGLHVGNEQVHHEVARMLRMVEILEQETAVTRNADRQGLESDHAMVKPRSS
jgi:hypothetical protein